MSKPCIHLVAGARPNFMKIAPIVRALRAVAESAQPVRWFVLNAEANVDVDITAADLLDELRVELGQRGVVFAMARVKQDLSADLAPTGFWERVGADRVFPTLPTAVAAYRSWAGLPDDTA